MKQESTTLVRMSGVFEVNFNHVTLSFRSERIRAMLAYLLIEANRPHSREKLTKLFWESFTEKSAKQNLRQSLARMRLSLAPLLDAFPDREIWEVQGDYVQLNLNQIPVQIDVIQLDKVLELSQFHVHEDIVKCRHCIALLTNIAETFQGDFLATLDLEDCPRFCEWKSVRQKYFNQQQLFAWEQLGKHELAIGASERALKIARKQLTIDPNYVPAQALTIRALMAREQYHSAQAFFLTKYENNKNTVPTELLKLYVQCQHKTENFGTAKSFINNAPALANNFFGRENEMRYLSQLLIDPTCRWVTIAGEGGIGKTTLALASSERILSHFPDGIWFIPLHQIKPSANEEDVVEQIATAIAFALKLQLRNVSILAQIQQSLAHSECLLILDNFEHVQAGATIINKILDATQKCKVLVTSRHALGFVKSHLVLLHGLQVEKEIQCLPKGAVALFIEGVIRHAGNFEFTDENIELAINICDFLAGHPLAINLASSWANQESLQTIYEKILQSYENIESYFPDVPDRHRSIQTVFEYSWELLSTAEQRLMAQISVFQDIFSTESVAHIAENSDLLVELEKKSLVKSSENSHYYLHETLRQFAENKLEITYAKENLAHTTRDKHTHYYLHLLGKPFSQSNPFLQQYKTLLDGFANIKTAIFFALHNHLELLLIRHLPKLGDFYESNGALWDAESLFNQIILVVRNRLQQTDLVDKTVQIKLFITVLIEQTRICLLRRNLANAERLLEDVVKWMPETTDPAIKANYYYCKTFLLLNIDQNSKQLPNLIKQGLDFARQCNDKSSESRFLCAMASNTANRQAIDESESYFRQAIRLAEEIGDLRLLAVTLANYQVQLFYNIGNYEKALNTSQRIVELTKELNMLEVEIGTLGMMSTIYLEQGNIDHAIDLINMGIDKSKKFSYEGMLWMFDFAHLLSEVYTDFANVNLETIRLHEKESPFIAPYGWIIEAKVLFYRQQYKVALLRLEKLLQNKVIPLGWVQRSRLLLYASYAALKSEYWQRAGEYFGLLEEVFISIKNKKGLAEVKAGQALCYWHLGRKKDAAMVLDELILALNEGLEIAGMIEPFTFIIHVSTLLQEMGEHQQARETLEIGVRELKRRANTLSDETQRQNFLRHSPDVRQLLARLV